MTWVEYAYADWGDDWSGYTPPNSDHHRGSLDDLPTPVYDADDTSGPYTPQVDWAEVLIELAVERYGRDGQGNYGTGPSMAVWCPDCWCGWTSRIAPCPCWYCHPQPAPKLIVPGERSQKW